MKEARLDTPSGEAHFEPNIPNEDQSTQAGDVSSSETRREERINSPIETCLLERSDLFSGSCVLINALTVLDIFLSRRTKPWRFFLRVLYRVSRSNLKWTVFWLIWLASSQLGSQYLTEQFGAVARMVTLTDTGLQMQRAWLLMQSYPIWSTLSFLIYSLVAGWFLRRFMPRAGLVHTPGERRAASRNGTTGNVGVGRAMRSIDQSRWSILIDCLFRPISFGTAQNLTDLDLELDDNMELLIERLALPNLWLTPVIPTDYLKYLPVWQFNGWDDPCKNSASNHQAHSTDPQCIANQLSSRPTGMIPSPECAICLDKYRSKVFMCGLPCGHPFHRECIMIWLQRDNHHCPICRWPAYQVKCFSPSPSTTQSTTWSTPSSAF